MRKHRQNGTSLIEILVVIVVFLVGILGLVQVFPLGLGVLRRTNASTLAISIARAELERINAQTGQIPELIAPVSYLPGNTIVINPGKNWNDLLPVTDTLGVGRLQVVTKDGSDRYAAGTRVAEVLVDPTTSIGAWQKVAGANHFTRVFGEGRRAPAPRQIGSYYGSLLQLQFAPIYYFRDAGTGLAANGLVQIYGNDLTRRDGASDNRVPDALLEADDYAFYTMPGYYATDPAQSPFPNEDQIWVGSVLNGFGPVEHRLRVSVSFGHQAAGGSEEIQLITEASLAESNSLPIGQQYMTLVNNRYWVVSIPRLLSKPGSPYALADYLGADVASIRVQRLYEELPAGSAFDPNDPYEFIMLDSGDAALSVAGMGSVLVNPAAFEAKVGSDRGLEPLHARADYTVFDWRILKDDFRVPREGTPLSVKLTLNSIKALSGVGPDSLSRTGLELSVPNLTGAVVSLSNGKQIPQDFVLIDVQTGGVVLGNAETATSSYQVNKRTGVLEFNDLDVGAPGIQARIALPDSSTAGGWTTPVTVTMDGRSVRAFYMGTNEWAVQPHKAADSYFVSSFSTGVGLMPGECYVGGSRSNGLTPIGQTTRIYFPFSDLGHRVAVSEIWRNNGGTVELLQDREFQISGTEQVEGVTLSYVDVGAPMSNTRTGYAVRGVTGLTMKVRVLWNPESFTLNGTPEENFSTLEVWGRSWRHVEAQDVFSRSVN